MNKKASNCAICDNSNRASICAACANYRLSDCYTLLKSLKSCRDALYLRLSEVLVAKGKADDQLNWRVLQNDKVTNLREKLQRSKEQLSQGKLKIERVTCDLKIKYGVLESALSMMEKNRAEQLEKLYPNLICTQSLGHIAIVSELLHKQSVVIKQICKLFPQCRVNIEREREEMDLAVSMTRFVVHDYPEDSTHTQSPQKSLLHLWGNPFLLSLRLYMVQLLNLVVQNLAVPVLHNSGFAGSCSCIWQHDSYWDARPSSQSNEYPLFIPRQNYCSSSGENSWTDRNSINFGVASMESKRGPQLVSSRSTSFNYTSASPHSVETHKDLQKGISLLKKSVACLTAYCYNSLHLDVPSEASTFEAFAKLLATLSSSKEVLSVFTLKMACSRSCKQVQQLNKSVWNMNSAISSTTLLESITKSLSDNNLPSLAASFLYPTEISDIGKNEALLDDGILWSVPLFLPRHHKLRMLDIGLEPCLLMVQRSDM